MTSCEKCGKSKAMLWFEIWAVCQKCYNKMAQAKIYRKNREARRLKVVDTTKEASQ